ncbi:hypothetical protein BDP27DRAFT_1328056 [Rhodocollybia butyracea]|uniref:C2H2-type domain-containing protein n=1 Tax=Rhodocollybia butyracea TaxID=206335 RepID=A0A9P5PR95_9AGAR|nr:hypothetical protein BDP27DRAFT_1328056 [Rhodocollybia butyracea]
MPSDSRSHPSAGEQQPRRIISLPPIAQLLNDVNPDPHQRTSDHYQQVSPHPYNREYATTSSRLYHDDLTPWPPARTSAHLKADLDPRKVTAGHNAYMGPSRVNAPQYPHWNNSQSIPGSNPPYPYHNEGRSSPIPFTVHHGRPTADEYAYPLHTTMSGPQNSSTHYSGANFMSGIGERETREIAYGKLNYICEYCGKGFLRPSALKTHVISHTGDQEYACPEEGCSRKFGIRSNMLRHVRLVHRNLKHSSREQLSPDEWETGDAGR